MTSKLYGIIDFRTGKENFCGWPRISGLFSRDFRGNKEDFWVISIYLTFWIYSYIPRGLHLLQIWHTVD